jgi:hypothetical protein
LGERTGEKTEKRDARSDQWAVLIRTIWFRASFQFWRLFTNFFFFGAKFSLEFLFHMFFLVQYCRSLEEGSFRGRTADFFYMILFGSTLLTLIAPFADMHFLGSSLTFMMVYIWARRNPLVRMTFLGLFTFTAPYLPWVLLCFSVLLGNDGEKREFRRVKWSLALHCWKWITDHPLVLLLSFCFLFSRLPLSGPRSNGGHSWHRDRASVLFPRGRVPANGSKQEKTAENTENHVRTCRVME